MSQQVSPLFFFPAFNTVFWMPLSMLNVFYCFAHPERETAGALINGWKRWAGCHCGFPGRSDPAEPVPVQEGWGMGSLGVRGAGSGGGWTLSSPSTGLTHHHPTAEHGFPAWPLPPASPSGAHPGLQPLWHGTRQARRVLTRTVCRACPGVPTGDLIQLPILKIKGSWGSEGVDMGSRKHPPQHPLPRKRHGAPTAFL